MRIPNWVIPQMFRGLESPWPELVTSIKRRDDEIQNAVNANAGFSAQRYSASFAVSDTATAVTLVEAPPPGTSRLVDVTSATVVRMAGASKCNFFLDDGVTHHHILYNSALAWFLTETFPSDNNEGPLVLESPYSLKFVTDVAGGTTFDLTASWRDDVPSGESASKWGLGVAVSPANPDSDDYVTLVESPAEGRVRRVNIAGFSNDDDVVHHYGMAIYDIANADRYVFSFYVSANPHNAGSLIEGAAIYNVPFGYQLEAVCSVAENADPSHFFACYQEMNVDDSYEV